MCLRKLLLYHFSIHKPKTQVSEADKPNLEAIQGHKQPQDVVGSLEDPEDSQISHHSLHS